MKQILLISIILLFSGCTARYDERLLGSWKSDREGTVAEFVRRFPDRFEGKPEKKEKFSKIFGHQTHTFTPNDVTVEFPDSAYTIRYKVLEIGNDYVLIETYGEYGDEIKIKFTDNFNSFWLNEDSSFLEKYTKIDTEQQN